MRRNPLVVLIAIAGVAVAADTLAWVWTTGRIEAGAAAWLDARRAEGWSVTASPPRRAGWPFSAEVVIPDLVLAGGPAEIPGGLSWQLAQLRLRIDPLQPRVLAVELVGSQRVRLGTLPPATLAADSLVGHVSLDDPAQPVRIDAAALHVETAGQSATVALATLRVLPGAIDMDVHGIDLPNGVPRPFGPAIARFAATVRLDGAVPAAADLPRAAASWRDAGGRLTVVQASIQWSALDAQGSGALTLDPALQPRATGVLRLAGYTGAIDALAQSGAIRANDARVATTLLGLLAHATPGTAPEVTLPLTLSDGVLSVGNFPVARVPGLAWGLAAPGG